MDNQQPSIQKDIYNYKPKEGYGLVYSYTSPSGKQYIGQTIGSLNSRAKNTINGSGYKKCTLFWKAINKYGWQKFAVNILEEVPYSELNNREQYYIEKYNTLAPNGYNLTYGGDGGKKIPVYVYSAQNGKFLAAYSSLTEASEMTGVGIETISAIMSTTVAKRRTQSHNLTFRREYVDSVSISELDRKSCREVYVYNLDGEYIRQYHSITKAAKELNCAASSIYKCLNGFSGRVGSYRFLPVYAPKLEPLSLDKKGFTILQVDPNTNEVIQEFSSAAAAARAVGLKSSSSISRAIKRDKGTSGGYRWKRG